jgi:hypothetical protein
MTLFEDVKDEESFRFGSLHFRDGEIVLVNGVAFYHKSMKIIPFWSLGFEVKRQKGNMIVAVLLPTLNTTKAFQ